MIHYGDGVRERESLMAESESTRGREKTIHRERVEGGEAQ